MKSYIAKPADIDHKWYVIDAEDKTLGKVAAEIAMILEARRSLSTHLTLTAEIT